MYGEYIASASTDDEDKDDCRLTLSSSGIFSYTRKTIKEPMDMDEYQCSGLFTCEDVNSDIVKLIFSISDESGSPICGYSALNYINKWNTCLYKYKNMIGKYIEMDTANVKNRSCFKIDSGDGEYLLFAEDGLCRPSSFLDDDDFAHKYKVKSGVIWIDYDVGFGFQPEYFIVEDGLFYYRLIKSR